MARRGAQFIDAKLFKSVAGPCNVIIITTSSWHGQDRTGLGSDQGDPPVILAIDNSICVNAVTLWKASIRNSSACSLWHRVRPLKSGSARWSPGRSYRTTVHRNWVCFLLIRQIKMRNRNFWSWDSLKSPVAGSRGWLIFVVAKRFSGWKCDVLFFVFVLKRNFICSAASCCELWLLMGLTHHLPKWRRPTSRIGIGVCRPKRFFHSKHGSVVVGHQRFRNIKLMLISSAILGNMLWLCTSPF